MRPHMGYMTTLRSLRPLPLRIRYLITSPTISRAQHFGFANLAQPKTTSHSPAMEAKFSPGADESQLMEETKALLGARWKLDKELMGLEKTFYFKTWTKVLDFSNVVGVRCKSKNHHPKMTIETGSVYILWTTHHPRGLSSKDTFMAKYCDEQAKLIGDVDKSEAQKCRPAPAAQI